MTLIDKEKQRLGKLIQLAKRGEGYEKEAAAERVKRICSKLGIEFDSCFEEEEAQEYNFPYQRGTHLIVTQIVFKYAKLNRKSQVYFNRFRKLIFTKTTKQKYIETTNALSVLVPLYKAEKKEINKRLELAFVQKNDLYYNNAEEEEETKKTREPSQKEIEENRAAAALADQFSRGQVFKQLKK